MITVDNLLYKLYEKNDLSREELLYILYNINQDSKKKLFYYACKVRDAYYGNKVYVRGLIEFSNICKMDCLYCGIRSSNKNALRYRLTKEEILNCCIEGYNLGYRTFVLQSGEDPWYTEDRMVDIIKTIKNRFPDVAITLSIGERDKQEYKSFFEAGADRYLLRHETASRKLYGKLHPHASFDNRINCLKVLKEIGYQVGAGFMVGLPDQNHEDLVEDLIFLKSLNPHMIGIGPFIPHSQTPLADAKGGTVEDTLVMIALTRLMVPDALLPATTAMGTLHPKGRELALQAGANVVMPNISPTSVRPKYELYENKICIEDNSAHCRFCIENRIKSIGMVLDTSRGDHCKYWKAKECN